MSFAVQLVSDFASIPYVLRQRHGVKVIPPPVTCVMLMMCKMSSMSFSTASIHMISLRRIYASLFPPTVTTVAHDVSNVLSQNKLFSLSNCFEQASSHTLTEGLPL